MVHSRVTISLRGHREVTEGHHALKGLSRGHREVIEGSLRGHVCDMQFLSVVEPHATPENKSDEEKVIMGFDWVTHHCKNRCEIVQCKVWCLITN